MELNEQTLGRIADMMAARLQVTNEDVMAADDVNGDGSLYYVGYVKNGTLDSETKWKIMRVTKTGNVYRMTYPTGSKAYSYAWSLRATYTYV